MQGAGQTLKPKCDQSDRLVVETLMQTWRSRLALDYPEQSAATRESIIQWLLGSDSQQFEMRSQSQREVTQQGMLYRYRILRERYLGVAPDRAYRCLMTRLSSLVVLRNKIRTWVSLSRDRRSSIIEVLQEFIQELLQRDRYLQQQISWSAQCTGNAKLRHALLFASIEEYCLRPIRNQPLLLYRFVNYMRRTSRGGVTQVPKQDELRLVFEEIPADDNEGTVNLMDLQAISQYQNTKAWEEQQMLRETVKKDLSRYLAQQLGPLAVKWLQLYLQGHSQQAIAQILDLPVKEVYRLREKVSYHATRVFARKYQHELVGCLGN